MTTADALPPPNVIAISVSESPDMSVFGLSNEHLRGAMGEIALHLLADGVDLVYGGDWRRHGFTNLLFELLDRYRHRTNANSKARVTNYLAWPAHIVMAADALDGVVSGLHRHSRIVLIGRNGKQITVEERRKMSLHKPDDHEWSEGLTTMRKIVCAETDARVVLGGRIEDYKGKMPGIAEEVLLSFELGLPVFLIGGFGGCTRDIAETLGLVDPWAGSRSAWPGRQQFERYGPDNLRNGLSREENEFLAGSLHVSQAVTLILRGLHHLRKSKPYNPFNTRA